MGNNTRRDGRVEPGQKIASAFSARAWNRAQDAADLVLDERGRFGAGPQAGRELAPNVVLIRNGSGQDIPWLGVLGISGVAINPSGGELDGTDEAADIARRFARGPVLSGATPQVASHADAFVVAMEPIAAGAIGRAAIGGMFACKVNVTDVTHRFAVVKNNDVTQLQSARCGPLQLVWKDGSIGECRYAVGVM